MSDSVSRLPARPSLEQLQKQAKDLLRDFRSGDRAAIERLGTLTSPAALADAQFVIAREYGFDTWAKLKHHVQSLQPSGMEHYEILAKELAAAYETGRPMEIRELNWRYGTSFACDFHEPIEMQRQMKTWFAAQDRTADLLLADARQIVAHLYGFEDWAAFAASISQPAGDPRSAPVYISAAPPFYKIDWRDNSLSIQGPQTGRDWSTILGVIQEHGISKVCVSGITDELMGRLPEADCITALELGDSTVLTDEGVAHLARMPQLRELEMGGWTSPITDRGLEVLAHLKELRLFKSCWTRRISDAGVAHLASAENLEEVNLLGSSTGDGAIRALSGKRHLRQFSTGRGVTDTGIELLHQLPVFKTWQGGEINYGLMGARVQPNRLLIDGPFTDHGLAKLSGLDGLFGLTFFWHCPAFTSAGLAPLKHLPKLGALGCQDAHCDDEAMRHIAAIPELRMLMGQGAVATDEGFAALSRSKSIEYIWGRDCPNLGERGFRALASMPRLRGLAASCKNVGDDALATLPDFPALREFMPMDVPDEGFRHVGRCLNLEKLWCMYCRETGDVATGHLAGLSRLKLYYAGMTLITDRSLEILGRMNLLEQVEFWTCAGLTNAGFAHLAKLPNLREITMDGLSGVTREAISLFPEHVRVNYSG